jgi:ABC-type uncharacterized transport system involved in gliding motility auxiliary subunit
MKPTWQKFAPIGLYLALVAAVAALALYIVQKQFNLYLQIALGLVVVGLAIYALLNPVGVRQAFTGRQARYGSNLLVLTLAFLGILVVINFVAYKNPKHWDLTEDKQHTLSPETITMLGKLPDKVNALAFFQAGSQIADTQNLLDSYKYNSGGKLDYKIIDPDADPVTAQAAKITKYGSVVFQAAGRQELAKNNTEQEFSAALIRLMNPGSRAVYFLTGHGEYDPSGNSSDRQYTTVKRTLESKSYTVNTLNLLVNPQIPADALALIVAGPLSPLSQGEVDLIKSYLDGGGSLVAFVEPPVVTNSSQSNDPLVDYLSTEWGLTFRNDLILDMGANPNTMAIGNPQDYPAHPVTTDLKNRNMVTIFPTARSIEVKTDSSFNPVPLVKTSQQSWAETDLTALQNNQANPDENADVLGPVQVAVALTNSTTNARLLVVGDADFAADGNFDAYGNGDFFSNSIDWAAEQENLISLTPKQTTQRIMVTPKTYTLGLILLGSVFVLPGIFLVSGVVNWLQRRRRG